MIKDDAGEQQRDVLNLLGAPKYLLLQDAPLGIASPFEEDSFSLANKLKALYDAIRHPEMRTPFAAMIAGGWGTGKTSSMLWLRHSLAKWNASKPFSSSEVRVKCVWFNAWKYQTKEEVWRGLISEVILSSIEVEADVHQIRKAAKQMVKFLGAGFSTALSAIEVRIGSTTSGITLKGKELVSGMEGWNEHIQPQQTYMHEFEGVLKEWLSACYPEKGKKRLCIFIDDLDRCLPEVALQTLEAIKLYLDAPGLIFIVGIDKDIITDVLYKKYEDTAASKHARANVEGLISRNRAHQYLDKLFQIEVDITPDERDIEKFVEAKLRSHPLWAELDVHKDVFQRLVLRESRTNPRSALRNLNVVIQAVAQADSSASELSTAQLLQQIYIQRVFSLLDPPETPLTREGRYFLEEWADSIAEDPKGPSFIPKRIGRALENCSSFAEASKSLETDPGATDWRRYSALIRVAMNNSRFAHLMGEERLGLLLTVPYPRQPRTSEPALYDRAPAILLNRALSSQLRLAISESNGIAPEDVNEAYLHSLESLSLESQPELALSLGDIVDLSPNLRDLWLNNTPVNDRQVQILSRLGKLKSVDLSATSVTDDGMKSISALSGLRYLSINSTQISDNGVQALAELKDLTSLHLSRTPISDASSEHLTQLVGLETLNLRETGITSASLKHLSNLAHLTTLSLSMTKVNDTDLELLIRNEKLHTIWLDKLDITDAGLTKLALCKELKTIGLDSVRITSAGFRALWRVSGLSALWIVRTPTRDDHLKQIAECPKLETLGLDYTKISNDGLKHLVSLPNLRTLTLRGTKITSSAFDYFSAMKALEHLGLEGVQIPPASLSVLRSRKPNLSVRLT